MVLCLPIKVVGGGDGKQGHAGEALGGRNVPDLHDAGGILVGERAEEHSIDNGEDCRVGPDAERQDQACGEGEPRIPQQDAQAEAKVVNQVTHGSSSPATVNNDNRGDTDYRRRRSHGCFHGFSKFCGNRETAGAWRRDGPLGRFRAAHASEGT